MSKFRCEMFGHFVYDESLSYHELLDVEARLIGNIQLLLEDNSAEHIDFSPLGDELMVQCAFEAYEETLFRSLSDGLRPTLPEAVDAKLLFVDKHLASLYVFHINSQQDKGQHLNLPSVHETFSAKTKAPKTERPKA